MKKIETNKKMKIATPNPSLVTPLSTRKLNGILLLDKSQGMSSNTALQRAKRLFFAQKAGHTGALDPLATGLLPVCFGEATKFSQYLIDANKTYEVIGKLGENTDTGDSEGQVIASHAVPALSLASMFDLCQQFTGPCQQVPPMYSALKHQGKPLYRYAREGKFIERDARDIQIYACECLRWESPYFHLRVHCSKGTYIRVLIEDMGAALGCGAHVTSLRRVSIDGLPERDMYTEGALTAMRSDERDALLHPLTVAIQNLPKLTLPGDLAARFRLGQKIDYKFDKAEMLLAVFDVNDSFLGTAEVRTQSLICPKRLLANAS